MIAKMDDIGRPLSPQDIQALEKAINAELLEDYRAFLLKYNGGVPVPNAFPIQGMKNNPIGILQEFFGIDQHVESSNLVWNYETLKMRLPSNLFAIAGTGSGDLVCLILWGDDAGSVVFWDSYGETEPPTYQNVYRVADNFNVFIASIHQD